MILIVSDRADQQIYHVMLELESLGAKFGLFNAGDFPSKATSSQTISADADECVIELEDGQLVSTAEVSAVWYRKPRLPRFHHNVGAHEREYVFHEAMAGLRGIYDSLRHAYWINPLSNMRFASNKLEQLRRAKRFGFAIPSSLYTNSQQAARSFIEETGKTGRVVVKAIGEPALYERAGSWDAGSVVGELFTTLLDADLAGKIISRLDAGPALFQAYVPKASELRVTVVDESVFAVKIFAQSRESSKVDWRRGDVFGLDHEVYALPDEVADRCRTLTASYGLAYGAIDLIENTAGEYVFLELNPNGQYGWMEAKTPLAISRAIAESLVRDRA